MNITDGEAGFNTVNLRFIDQKKMKISIFDCGISYSETPP